MNKCIFVGRIGKDLQLQEGNAGKYVRFTLAVDRPGKDKKTDWPNFTAFGKTAETMCQYLGKGRKIMVEAEYRTDTYVKDGQNKTSTGFTVRSFEFCDSNPQTVKVDNGDNFEDIAGELPFN